MGRCPLRATENLVWMFRLKSPMLAALQMKSFLLLVSLAFLANAAITDEPVDDRLLQAELLRFAEAQLNADQIARVETLKSQLVRQLCEVALAAPSTATNALPVAAARVRPGVAVVGGIYKCKKCSKWHLNAASGFFVSSDGIFVTNHHVIASGDKEALVVLSGDNRMSVVSELLAADPVADIAILRCEGSGFTALPLSAAAPDGSPVGVWSHPNNHFFCLSSGIIARRFVLRKPGGSCETLAITADYARGSSGGPVFDDRGNVIGMVASTDSVYYTEEHGQQKNLQMVFKNCVSARNILALIDPKPAR
jgi:serine protease Do